MILIVQLVCSLSHDNIDTGDLDVAIIVCTRAVSLTLACLSAFLMLGLHIQDDRAPSL